LNEIVTSFDHSLNILKAAVQEKICCHLSINISQTIHEIGDLINNFSASFIDFLYEISASLTLISASLTLVLESIIATSASFINKLKFWNHNYL
jgi:hypothetical protein